MNAKSRLSHLTALLFGIALGAGSVSAADLEIVGKWMATETASVAKAQDGPSKSSMRWAPGAFTVEFEPDTITTTLAFPGRPPLRKTAGYTVVARSATATTLAVADPKSPATPKTTEITQAENGLLMRDDTSATKLMPYDPAAVAAEQQRQEEAKRPAEPLKDQPLSGRLNGADWVALECRRTSFQADPKGERIGVRVTAEQLKPYQPSEKPALLVDLPTKVGEYPLSNVFNVTATIPPSRNAALVNGTLVITKVTESSIEFGLTARGRDGNVVNGRMTADISALPEGN